MSTPPPSHARRYTRSLLAAFFAAWAVLALFLMVVDPYGIYRDVRIPHAGVPALTWSRIAAAERLADRCDVGLLGSSRVVFSFGTRVPGFGRAHICNGALGGTSMAEIRDVVDYVVEDTSTKSLVLFVDLHMFHDGRGTNQDYKQSLFNPTRDRITYHLWALSSLDAIEWSTKMVGIYLPIYDGPKPLRSSSMETRGMIKATLLKPEMYRVFQGPDRTVDDLRHVLDTSLAHDVRIMVIIPPVHAMQHEAMHTAGLEQVFADWKRMLVRETHARDVMLWDFATYNSPVNSVLPTAPLEPANPWWSDMTHPSQLLGSTMMERIRDEALGKQDEWEPSFGVMLTPDNVEAQIAMLEDGRAAWRATRPDQLVWYDKVLDNIRDIDATAFDDFAANRRRAAGEHVPFAAPRAIDLGDDEDIEF